MAEESSPKKSKRTAERQISKDDDSEGDGGVGGSSPGTFQRATDNVLRARRIVKPRARPFSTGAGVQAASENPFRTVVLPPSKPTEEGPKDAVNGGGGGGMIVPVSSHEEESASSSSFAVVESPSDAAAEAPSPGKAEDVEGGGKVETVKATGTSSNGPKPPAEERPEVEAGASEKAAEKAPEETGQSIPALPVSPVPVIEKHNNVAKKGDEGENGTAGGAKKLEAPAVGAGSGGVISFAALGAGKTADGPFKSLMKGASPSGVPLTFAGFGSAAVTAAAAASPSPHAPATASFGTPLVSATSGASLGSGAIGGGGEAAKAAKPLVSFGAAAKTVGGGSGFASFTSFAFAPPGGSLWGTSGSLSKGTEAGSGSRENTGGGEKGGSEGSETGGTATKDISAQASLELMDPSEVVNGEESEKCTHRTRAKLFRLVDKEWVEMGIGYMKVLRPTGDAAGTGDGDAKEGAEGGKGEGESGGDSSKGEGESGEGSSEKKAPALTGRLVMRREAGQQVMLNVALQEQTRCSTQGEKALMISCFTPDGPMTYLLKVKTLEDARSLKAAIALGANGG